MTVNVSGRVPRVVTVNKGRQGPAGIDGDGVSPNSQFGSYASFALARSGSNPPSDTDIVIILQDERNSNQTISGPASEIETYTESG